MSPDRTRRRVLTLGATLAAVGATGCLGAGDDEPDDGGRSLAVANAKQYSAPGCGCCHQYAAYLDDHIETALAEDTPDDVTAVKRRHGVPEALRSCHTVVLDGYVVEGHVPVAAIATLLDEQPAIDGIALPGMPAGSPGMGGTKRGAFTVHVIGGDRTGDVYAEV